MLLLLVSAFQLCRMKDSRHRRFCYNGKYKKYGAKIQVFLTGRGCPCDAAFRFAILWPSVHFGLG